LTIFENNNNNNNNNNSVNICKEIGGRVQIDIDHWCDHVPEAVETSQEGTITILWNQQVRTDSIIPNNKPDIIIRENNKGASMLIFAAIPSNRNVMKVTDDI